MASRRKSKKLEKQIEVILHDRLGHFLEDISFRLNQVYEVANRVGAGVAAQGRVYAEDLILPGRHMLTGFTMSSNTPVAGSIAWTDLHMVYAGGDHTITSGNTAMTYVWWDPTTPTALKSSNTKPTLPEGGALVFMNEGGIARNMLSETQTTMPRVVATDAVDNDSIQDNAVQSSQLGNGAVTNLKLGDNAVTDVKINAGAVTNTKLGNGAVTDTKLGDGAVTNLKIGNGAVTDTKIGTGAVTNVKLGDNAVTDVKISTGAVTNTKLGNGAVTDTKLGDGAVTNLKLGNGAVTDTKLGNGAVTNAKLDDAAVSAQKLNVLRHFIF